MNHVADVDTAKVAKERCWIAALQLLVGRPTTALKNAFRKALGLVAHDGWIAHHLIPFGKSEHLVVQKAAEGGFHINDVMNGIKVSAIQQAGSHPQYDLKVQRALDDIVTLYGNSITPTQAMDGISLLLDRIRSAISNNPNIPLNELIF